MNDPKAQHIANMGPIPVGSYYIVDRVTGGILGAIIEPLKKDWFSLYADDGIIDDQTTVGQVTRGQFRMHYGTVSNGCITFSNKSWFQIMRNDFINTDKKLIPNTNIWAYGKVTVVE